MIRLNNFSPKAVVSTLFCIIQELPLRCVLIHNNSEIRNSYTFIWIIWIVQPKKKLLYTQHRNTALHKTEFRLTAKAVPDTRIWPLLSPTAVS